MDNREKKPYLLVDSSYVSFHRFFATLIWFVNVYPHIEIEDDYDWKVENFKDLPVVDFNNYALFFSAVYPMLLDATLSFLETKREEMEALLDGSH